MSIMVSMVSISKKRSTPYETLQILEKVDGVDDDDIFLSSSSW